MELHNTMDRSDVLDLLMNSGISSVNYSFNSWIKYSHVLKVKKTELLCRTDINILSLLRIKLFVKLVETLTGFDNYELRTRRKKLLLCEEIYTIAQSLVVKTENKCLKNILRPIDIDNEKTLEMEAGNCVNLGNNTT